MSIGQGLTLQMRRKFTQSDNLPLEITLYFSAYIATLQRRQVLDVPTCNAMLQSVAKFSSDLTALEKIISTRASATLGPH